jgi:type VI secretion system ImpA/VasJ family protein
MTSTLGTQPIPGAKPAGVPARYEADFTQLEAEIAKLGNPAGGEIKWKDVVNLSRSLLSEKSKDLLIGSYHAYALLQQQGYQGLLEGIKTVNGMCQTFWDGMFPEVKRMKARETALDWLIDRVSAHLEKSPPLGSDEGPVLKQIMDTWENLSAFINPKLETQNPKLPAFSRALSAKAGATGAAAGPTQPGAAMADAPTSTAAASGPAGPITNRKVAFERLKEVAEFLKRTEPHSPVAYLVQRAIKWGDMSLENVITELVKNNDVRKQIMETLGVKQDGQDKSD